MGRLREMTDFRWSSSGDFVLDSEDQDILDTSRENFQGAIQRLQNRIGSRKGDWQHAPSVGATLHRFVGKPNTPEVGAEIQQAIVNELTRGNLLTPNELEVQVFPISKTSIMVFVRVVPRGQRETISLIASYDLTDNKISMRN